MALPILKGLVANYSKLGYQLWHRPLKMASLVYEREIGSGGTAAIFLSGEAREEFASGEAASEFPACHISYGFCLPPTFIAFDESIK